MTNRNNNVRTLLTKRSHSRGFTLIEILVVMIIISIVGSASIMIISHNRNSRLATLAKQMTNILKLADEQAMLQPATLGFTVTKDSFQVYQYKATKENQSSWQALFDPVLGLHHFSRDIQVTIKVADEIISPSKDQPQIILSASGDITPFTILIGDKNKKPYYQISGEENGSISSGIIHYEK